MPLSSVPASVTRVLGAPGRWSVAAQTFALQVLIAVLVVGAGLVGAYGQAQRAGDQQAMARALPNGRHLHLPDGSHMSMFDDQQRYFSGVIDFLRDVDGRG